LRACLGEENPEGTEGTIRPGLGSLSAFDVVKTEGKLALQGDEVGSHACTGQEQGIIKETKDVSGQTEGREHEDHRGRVVVSR
jgi:hypothetical protein